MKILYWRVRASSSKNKVKLLSFHVFHSILYTLVVLSGLPSQRCKKKTKYTLTKHSSFPLPKKHVFWSGNLEVIHHLFRTQWDCNHKQSYKRACHQDRNKNLALILYNPGQSAVTSLRTWICDWKPPLWAATDGSCSVVETPEPSSSSGCAHALGRWDWPIGTMLMRPMLQGAKGFREKRLPPTAGRSFIHRHITGLQQMCAIVASAIAQELF